jgi:hypothetical protein
MFRDHGAIELAFSSIDEVYRDLWRFEYLDDKNELAAGLIVMPSGPEGCFEAIGGPFLPDGIGIVMRLDHLIRCPAGRRGDGKLLVARRIQAHSPNGLIHDGSHSASADNGTPRTLERDGLREHAEAGRSR